MTYDDAVKIIRDRLEELHFEAAEFVRETGVNRNAVYRLLRGENVGFQSVVEVLDKLDLVITRKEESEKIEEKYQKSDSDD